MAAENKQQYIRIVMTAEEMEALNQLAQLRGFKSRAAYVKDLIETDAADADVPLKFSGTWGGWRGGGAATSEE